MKNAFARATIFLLLGFSAAAQTNQWTKPTSGNWEESYWSLGRLPGMDQQFVAIDNYGWKAVAIGANTTANYPQSLSLNNLLIDGPTNSSNQLLLNWAGLSVPLVTRSNLTIGTNGSLVSHYSAIQAANIFIDGSASFSDYATENFGQLWLRPGANLNLINGTMTSLNLMFYSSSFTQSGGTHIVQNINPPGLLTNLIYWQSGVYHLQGGALISQQLTTGSTNAGYRVGSFWQSGGVHTNYGMTLTGYDASTNRDAYLLDGGLLVSSFVDAGSYVTQTGGTNLIQELQIDPGPFSLLGGELITSNTTVGAGGSFYQSGGTHNIQDRLLIQESSWWNHCQLAGGNLVAANLEISGGILDVYSNATLMAAMLKMVGGRLDISSNANVVTGNLEIDAGELDLSSHGTVSNTGILMLAGSIYADEATETQNLGQLQISPGALLYLHNPYSPAQPANPAVFRFANSHTLPWTGRLQIFQWGLAPGDHIYIGTDAHSLTVAQLAQIEFVGATVEYPALLLPTGELVPNMLTNLWTKPADGSWEESYWSLGKLPGMDQAFVVIDNPGRKAVAITPTTSANYPQSMSVNNLLIDSPDNTFNILLLNWAGLSVPLAVNLDLVIGTKGVLESHYSALHAENAYVDGSASFSDYSTENFNELWLRSDGALGLANGVMTTSNLTFVNGTFTQSGGTHAVNGIDMSVPRSYYEDGYGEYDLKGGTLSSQGLNLGNLWGAYGPYGIGVFVQSGGIHTNAGMSMWGYHSPSHGSTAGGYLLKGGLLVSGSLVNDGGYYSQTGGTNMVLELNVRNGGYFGMRGGELIVSNATIQMDSYVGGWCEQTGGNQIILGEMLVDGPTYGTYETKYSLSGGSLAVPYLDITAGQFYVSSNAALVTANISIEGYNPQLHVSAEATVSNTGIISISGRADTNYYGPANISVDRVAKTQYFGQLQIVTGGTLDCYGGINGAAVRFADSHQVPWSGPFLIWGWSPDNRVFFGSNAAGLTSAQLAQVTFQNPRGLSGNIAGILLPTGELVPAGVNFANGYAYVTTNNSITIVGYTEPVGNLVIPGTLAGLPVRTIGDSAFSSANLTSIVIPDTVTVIGDYAFNGCTNLTNVSIGNGVGSIGAFAFRDCALTNLVIPNSVTNIGDYAFYGCEDLVSLSIGNGMTFIPDYAFYNLTNLANVSIGTGVGLIDYAAFEDCTALTSITIPNSVTNIGPYAFYACTSLTNVVIGSGLLSLDNTVFGGCTSLNAFWVDVSNISYSSLDGVLFNKDRSAIVQYPLGRTGNYVIPDTVRTIEQAAFAGSQMASISGGSNLNAINDSAFSYCGNLTNIALFPALTSIGYRAFAGCYSLPGIPLGNSLTTIGVQAFDHCQSLRFISIPDSVTVIPDQAFQYSSLADLVIGKGVTLIGNLAFYNCSALAGVAIPNSVTNIGNSALYGCTNLAKISIGNHVARIGQSAFYNCTRLSSVTIPDSVTVIDYAAFGDCTNLASVSIGNGVAVIGAYAFEYCTGLTGITIPNSVSNIGQYAFYACTSLTNVSIGNGVTTIGDYAFQYCTALTGIIFPRSVTTIGYSAFSYSSILNTVYFRGSAPNFGGNAFYPATPTLCYLPGTAGWGTTVGGYPTAPWFLPTPTILNFGPGFGVQTNRFGFVISWATNTSVVVEISTNLSSQVWSALSTNSLVNGSCYFTDARWTDYPVRFYRVRGL